MKKRGQKDRRRKRDLTTREALRIEIARRERAEKALRESAAKLKEFQRLARIGHWERDLVADRITWSAETSRILGREPPRGKRGSVELEKMIHPDDRRLHERALRAALQGRCPYDVEYRIIRPDGEIRFIRVRDDIQRDQSGRAIRLFGTVQDVTEQRRAETLRVRYARLTPREREVMGLVVRGMLNKQIASQLGTAEITVKVQRARAMKKMEAASLAEFVRFSEALRAHEAHHTKV